VLIREPVNLLQASPDSGAFLRGLKKIKWLSKMQGTGLHSAVYADNSIAGKMRAFCAKIARFALNLVQIWPFARTNVTGVLFHFIG
jgi:hypothetical protein